MAFISFQPKDYFKTKLYTGSGSAQALTGVGFTPDWVWTKNRSYADNHKIVDKVRWVSSSNSSQLSSSTANAAGTQGIINSFDADGYTLSTGDRGWNSSNGDNFVSWNWKAANSTGSSNTDGSITSTVSTTASTGFSIVKFTGTGANATVGHGLSTAPRMIMIKNCSQSANWIVYHKSLTSAAYRISLDTTSTEASDSTAFNSTAPTSSVFSVGTSFRSNGSGNTLIAYCFADTNGFIKCGKYMGNSTTNGAFAYTGFKPAFVLLKGINISTSYGEWSIFDNKRPTVNSVSYDINPMSTVLWSNTSNTESEIGSAEKIQFHSNGFKMKANDARTNSGNEGYLYLAMAAEPFVASNGDIATAR